MEQKTTVISDDHFCQLEVEWNTYKPRVRMPDGTFQLVEQHKVTLVDPEMIFLSDVPRRTRIIDLSPQTALNLLHWLEQERDTLETLVTRLPSQE